MEHGTYIAVDSVPEKTSGPGQETEEEDEESMDWWTKYHASLDTLIEVDKSFLHDPDRHVGIVRDVLFEFHPKFCNTASIGIPIRSLL